MPRHHVIFGFVLACAAALALAGCKNSAGVFQDQNEGGWFAKPFDLMGKPDWARPTSGRGANLGPQGPVGPEDMVSADGQCAAPAAALAQAAEPTQAVAEPPPGADRPRLEPATPQVAGGIALGMTECQAVQRAGQPSNVAVSTGDKGERKVVLTYLSGPWPGIYTFTGGRLNVIDRAPEQPKPAKTPPKKTPKKPATPKTAGHEVERNPVR